jgi:hypothetical protein
VERQKDSVNPSFDASFNTPIDYGLDVAKLWLASRIVSFQTLVHVTEGIYFFLFLFLARN